MKVDNRNPSINLMQNMIKEEVEKIGFVYSAGKYERGRIKNILEAKEITGIAEKYEMDIFTFVRTIIQFSAKLSFWKGRVTNGETFYRNYVKILNELIKLKRPELKKEEFEADFIF